MPSCPVVIVVMNQKRSASALTLKMKGLRPMENFKIDVDADGIALITFDVPERSMNTLTSGVMAEIPQWVERVKTDDAIKGAVLTSGKASGFCAGADLGDMASGMLGGTDLQAASDLISFGA